MTKLFSIALLFFSSSLYAQQDTTGIKNSIQAFFAGMHSNDTALIQTSLDSSCFLYSIMQKKDGNTVLQEEKAADFLQQVAGLKGQDIDEQLLSYDIKIDGAMAIAWTPYKFYFNKQFSHCGVNVFTLIKRNNKWKILGITDTRRKQGCEDLH
jgi:hypothetical protein